jgi:hypothetical protein
MTSDKERHLFDALLDAVADNEGRCGVCGSYPFLTTFGWVEKCDHLAALGLDYVPGRDARGYPVLRDPGKAPADPDRHCA